MPSPNVSIVIGDVAPDDAGAKFIPGTDGSIWTDYAVQNRYKRSRSRYILGVTAEDGYSGDSAAFVQLSKGTLLWIADWTAARTGDVPLIPDPTPSDSTNWKLLGEHYQPDEVILGTDGVSPIYRISGTYVYGHRKPNDVTALNINFGRPPWVEDSFRRVLTTADFIKAVMDTGSNIKLQGIPRGG